jgi:predicted dehydrogenase
VHELIQALRGNAGNGTDFAEAMEVERLATAIRLAAKEMRWVKVSDV